MSHEILFYDDTHQYLVDGQEVPSVTTILSYMSNAEYGDVNKAVLDQAARRGSLVHEYTENIDYGCDPDEVEYEIAPYIKAYYEFRRDYKPDWILVEHPVYSEFYGYVGTLDRYGIIDGKRCIVDIKTVSSASKMQKLTTSAQTSAYAVALKETNIDYYTEKRYALYLTKDGEYNLVDLGEYDKKYDVRSWGIFNKCLDMYKSIQMLKELKPTKGKR